MAGIGSISGERGAKAGAELVLEGVRALALKAGFSEAGVVELPYEGDAVDAARFAEFMRKGYGGNMEYLKRSNEDGELVRARVQAAFPWARSVIVVLAGYNTDAPLSTAAAEAGSGWIARYAWSSRKVSGRRQPSDYHKVLLKRLRTLEAELKRELGEFESRAYVDTGPLVERAVARAAGVGWVGKNTCLIHPKLGSWNFLAVLVTALPVAGAGLTVPDRCGSCTRCLDACPTGALIAPRQMDARRCIAYLTIEHRGEIEESLMAGVGRQVFGCDICQDVCPWNRRAPLSMDVEMSARAELVNPALEWLAGLDEVGFEREFNGSPLRRTGFHRLRRNVAVAMGNSGLARFEPQLRAWSGPEAPAIVRAAARWALERLGGASG